MEVTYEIAIKVLPPTYELKLNYHHFLSHQLSPKVFFFLEQSLIGGSKVTPNDDTYFIEKSRCLYV